MITVVIRPFKSNGKFFPAGSFVDPTGFKLYKSRLGDGKLAVVDEHNLEDVARYLQIRQNVENAKQLLVDALEEAKQPKPEPEEKTQEVDPEYLEKVVRLAAQFDVEMEDRPLEDVVAEIKAKAAEAKKVKEE